MSYVGLCFCFSPLFTPHRTKYVDAAYRYRPSSVVCRSVCRSVTVVSLAKSAKPIKMPFLVRTRVCPRNLLHGQISYDLFGVLQLREKKQTVKQFSVFFKIAAQIQN